MVDHPEGALHSGNIADELAEAAGPLDVVVVSPARPVYQGQATHVTLAGFDGSMGIWPRHADLVAALGAGPLRIRASGGATHTFVVWGGFVKVGGNRVTILADHAVSPDEIDPEQVRKELAETLADLAHPRSDAEFEQLLQRRRWCAVRRQAQNHTVASPATYA